METRAVRQLAVLVVFALLSPAAAADDDPGKGRNDKARDGEDDDDDDKESDEGSKEGQAPASQRRQNAPGACPDVTLRALALEGETVLVTADGLDRPATLVRAAGNGDDFVHVAAVDAGMSVYHDLKVRDGTVYTYRLEVGGVSCDQVEVTAIPAFPTHLAFGLALLVGAVGFLVSRRK